MAEKCRSNKGKAKCLGVVLLHLVFCARAPRRVSVTKMPCLSGAEVEAWGNLSEVEAFTTRPASPGPAAGDGCASAAGLETFAEAMLDTKTNGGPHATKNARTRKQQAQHSGDCARRGGKREGGSGPGRKDGRSGAPARGSGQRDTGTILGRSLSGLACAERWCSIRTHNGRSGDGRVGRIA